MEQGGGERAKKMKKIMLVFVVARMLVFHMLVFHKARSLRSLTFLLYN